MVAPARTDAYHDPLIDNLHQLPGVRDVRSRFAFRTATDDCRLPFKWQELPQRG